MCNEEKTGQTWGSNSTEKNRRLVFIQGVGRVEGEGGVGDDRGFRGQVQLLGYF